MQQETLKILSSSCSYWCNWWGTVGQPLRLQSGDFTFTGREYLLDVMDCKGPLAGAMKATGGGFSECMGILPTLHGMISGRYPQGVGYFFPTNDDVQDYSKNRFAPLVSNNRDAIGQYVKTGSGSTDTAPLKKIGDAFLFLRGSRLNPGEDGVGSKKSSKLTGIQFDRAVCDEIDQFDPEAIAKIRGRMANACVDGIPGNVEERFIANPSDEDRGIDLYWQVSDQCKLHVQCTCGHWTCPIDEFMSAPDKCVGYYDDKTRPSINTIHRGFVRCARCGRPISNYPCKWVADRPSVENNAFYHWSHLSSLYFDPAKVLERFTDPPEGNIGDVYRLDLGLPYSSAEDKLQREAVYRCCGGDLMAVSSQGPCAMGVDVKKVKHVVIGYRMGRDHYKVIKNVEVEHLSDVHDLAKRYGVRSAVVDIRPYEDEVREFQKSEPYRVFLGEYTDTALQEAVWNDNTGVVKVHRTGILDKTHRLIVNGQIELPRRCKAVEDFAISVCKCVKSKETNKKTGTVVYRYHKTGDQQDDYRHALNYFVLAASSFLIAAHPGSTGRSGLRRRTINDYARI